MSECSMTHHAIFQSPVSPMDDDDLLAEILLRLPALPSSLPRASLVCKRWGGLVSRPGFLRRFRAHHRKAPLLGFFTTITQQHFDSDTDDGVWPFFPTLDPPDRIPAARFSLRRHDGDEIYDCRHGLVLFLNHKRLQALVWDPVSGVQRRLEFPPAFRGERSVFNGAVLCAAADQDHVHGSCLSGPFKVALVTDDCERAFACIYSSETGAWSHLVETALHSLTMVSFVMTSFRPMRTPTALIGDRLYWLRIYNGACILELDLSTQSLAVIKLPRDAIVQNDCVFAIMPAEDGGLGLILCSDMRVQLWKWKPDCDGAAVWVLRKTIEIDKLLSLKPEAKGWPFNILGVAEENNVIFICTRGGVFMINIQSMRFKKLFDSRDVNFYYPLTGFYAAGTKNTGGPDGAQLLQGVQDDLLV